MVFLKMFISILSSGPDKCPQSTTTKELHDAVAKRAGEEAKRRFMTENALADRIQRPDVVDVNALVGSYPKRQKTADARHRRNRPNRRERRRNGRERRRHRRNQQQQEE